MEKKLNPKIISIAKQVNSLLKQEACIQDYLKYSQAMNHHESLKRLEKELQDLHHQVHQGDETAYALYRLKKEAYDQYPLVCNYHYSKEEAIALMEHVSHYISSRLSQ